MQRITLQARRTCVPLLQTRTLATKPPPTTPKEDTKTQATESAIVKEAEKTANTQTSTKTMAEKDAELMQKLAGISGEGGESGVEYEDGKASAMKRSVKNNMFRLI